MDDSLHLLGLLNIKRLTENRLYALLERFHTSEGIAGAPFADLVPLVDSEIARQIKSLRIDDTIKETYKKTSEMGIRIIPYYKEEYPDWLKNIDHFPPVLFVRGGFIPQDLNSIAVVGTRGATTYGKAIAEDFAKTFAQTGITVVSGMARGVDTAAHLGALKKGGRTIAVLGCGLDLCYPPENRRLMADIAKHGAVISEFTIHTPPLAQNFPKRNRIISGLARAVIAIEAKEKSGVMSTVRWALDQNKEVFAVPGNIYAKTSQGTNRLIKEGAIPVTSAQEVLELLGFRYPDVESGTDEPVMLAGEEKVVWGELSFEPIYIDTLVERLQRPSGSILKTLLDLEFKGLIKQLPGMMFVKNLKGSG